MLKTVDKSLEAFFWNHASCNHLINCAEFPLFRSKTYRHHLTIPGNSLFLRDGARPIKKTCSYFRTWKSDECIREFNTVQHTSQLSQHFGISGIKDSRHALYMNVVRYKRSHLATISFDIDIHDVKSRIFTVLWLSYGYFLNFLLESMLDKQHKFKEKLDNFYEYSMRWLVKLHKQEFALIRHF